MFDSNTSYSSSSSIKGALWNYIPRKRNSNVSFYRWKNVYEKYLVILYKKLRKIVNNRYDNNVMWDDEANFELFCRFAYENSSKYINPMDRLKDKDDE